jgi:alpha-glucosidase
MVGETLMVMPVLKEEAQKASGYLPEGKWQHLWSGNVFRGQREITIGAPYGEPAVFINTDSERAYMIRGALEQFGNF